MRITRLRLTDIRCFKELELKLDGESALIIGDNGDGKSTVMRSLAMGLCDDSSAAALFRDLHGETVRKSCREGRGHIEVELQDDEGVYRTKTTIKRLPTFERVQQTVHKAAYRRKSRELHQDTFPWGRIFAVGYGPGLRVQGTADYDFYLTVDAVYPLFSYTTPLQNPELAIRRLVDAARRNGRGDSAAKTVLEDVRSLLKTVLQLDEMDQVQLTRTGIALKTGRQGLTELSAVGDGYRSTVTWILDLLSWWFLRASPKARPRNPSAIKGIVLLDEVEQHLHPRWQRNIMRLLTRSFPHIQFIATTHSPLVASGCEGIPVHRLSDGGHDVVSPFGWLAEDVYRVMGVPSSRAQSFREQVLEKFKLLDRKRLRGTVTPSESASLKRLRRELNDLPDTDPLRLVTEIENLERHLAQQPRKTK